MAGSAARGRGIQGLALSRVAARVTSECAGVLAPCPAVLRAAVLLLCPGIAGLLSPGRQHARPPAPAARAEQAAGSGVSGCPVPLNSPKPQRKLGEGFFFFPGEKAALLFLFPGLVGAVALNRGSLSSGASPAPRGVVLRAETPSSSEVREASDHRPRMQHRGCVQL